MSSELDKYLSGGKIVTGEIYKTKITYYVRDTISVLP
jgi:hypothetical protein